ncbi:hypothetical protein [Cellulomonas sp. Y8]|uniref:hypothetical protein n=1 Tax=Cellulomonas sp. Y8 TaxID=2591145 RepID=UPI003D7496F1
MRRSAREPGKSDPIDAEAVARVALREDDLPTVELPGPMREINLLSEHRRTLVDPPHRDAVQGPLVPPRERRTGVETSERRRGSAPTR